MDFPMPLVGISHRFVYAPQRYVVLSCFHLRIWLYKRDKREHEVPHLQLVLVPVVYYDRCLSSCAPYLVEVGQVATYQRDPELFGHLAHVNASPDELEGHLTR